MTSAQQISRTRQFHAEVRETASLSPKMRRLTLTAPDFAGQRWPLGCDIAIVLAGADGREVRRRYTVRSASSDALVVDAVLHGEGVGSDWAARSQPGDPVDFFGPRGELPAPPAGLILAVTDESGLPAIAAVAAATSQPVRVLAEIADAAEEYPLPPNAEVTWLPRDGRSPGDPTALVAAVRAVAAHCSYAYAITESRAVLQVRAALEDLGLHRTAICHKGYWNLKSRPTR